MASSCQFSDDCTKLEPKVVLALSRLARSKGTGRASGVAYKQVVEYLCSNYCSLDGDVESQVLTALLSCVRSGVVCALENGKYLLSKPGPKGMISQCITRTSHGPKCSCQTVIKRVTKNFQKACCMLKENAGSTKRTKKPTTKPRSSSKQPKKRTVCRSKPRKCAQNMVDKDTWSEQSGPEADPKCSYCKEVHVVGSSTSRKLCGKCNAQGAGGVVPFDKFSPREELT